MSHASPVSAWPRQQKVEAAIRRSLPLLPAEVRGQLEALLTPQALAVMTGVLVIWAGSHFVGVGEVADVLIVIIGVVALGAVAVEGARELVAFAITAIGADSEADLDKAARHFARAVSVLGVQAVLAVLLRKPKVLKGPNVRIGPPPPRRGAILYRSTITRGLNLPPNQAGVTSWWGDISISLRAAGREARKTELHERIHSFLTPKLYALRAFRVQFRANSYAKSELLRYLEEALSETFAQACVDGASGIIRGITFPVRLGYVRLSSMAPGKPSMAAELRGILLGPVIVGGMIYNASYSLQRPPIGTQP